MLVILTKHTPFHRVTGTFQEEEGADKCNECVVGGFCPAYSTDGDRFTLCPIGTYNDMKEETNEASCIKCPFGTYNDIKGGTNAASFIKCPIGTHNDIKGGTNETSCIKCPIGKFINCLLAIMTNKM